MTKKKHVITRRDFLRSGSCAVMGSLFGLPLVGRAAAQDTQKSRVVLIRDQKATDGYDMLNERAVVQMLDEAVTVLLGTPDPISAWRRIAKPDDIVGIKSNVWHYLPTPRELENAIAARLVEVGVGSQNISVDDRGVNSNPVFKQSTVLINIRPMRTHHWSGVGSCLKNYIMFHPHPWRWHGDSCADLAGLWKLPIVAGKTRLNILVMLTPLFHGKGPHHYNAEYTWEYKGLIVGRDPVAVDAGRRREGGHTGRRIELRHLQADGVRVRRRSGPLGEGGRWRRRQRQDQDPGHRETRPPQADADSLPIHPLGTTERHQIPPMQTARPASPGGGHRGPAGGAGGLPSEKQIPWKSRTSTGT